MRNRGKILTILITFIILSGLSCSSPKAKEVIPQSNSPSVTSGTTLKPLIPLATSINDIVGIWEGIGAEGYFFHFNEDGTCQIAISIENLGTAPDIESTFRFDGTNFVFTEVRVYNPALKSCGSKTGIYQVQLLPSGNIKFIKVSDDCLNRAKTMMREHKPLR